MTHFTLDYITKEKLTNPTGGNYTKIKTMKYIKYD